MTCGLRGFFGMGSLIHRPSSSERNDRFDCGSKTQIQQFRCALLEEARIGSLFTVQKSALSGFSGAEIRLDRLAFMVHTLRVSLCL
jgi:hypothetical protein